MKVFLHYKKQKIEQFIERWMHQNESYNQRAYDFDKSFVLLLADTKTFYKEIGETNKEAKISQLQIYFETALKGVDPLKLEKLKTGKRQNISISSFHCLTNMGNLLQDSLADIATKLQEAEETISQIILSGIQTKIIDDAMLQAINNIDKSKQLWTQLTQNEQISLIDKKLRLTMHQEDIPILVDGIITKIK